jgi:hypothetical protein
LRIDRKTEFYIPAEGEFSPSVFLIFIVVLHKKFTDLFSKTEKMILC